MILEEHISKFSKTLSEIVTSEISLGNKINDTFYGYPYKDSIYIGLEYQFIGVYKKENVIFRKINDIRYWKAEYVDTKTNHILTCYFPLFNIKNSTE